MRLLNKYFLAPALVSLLVGPALAQRSSPPTASQITPRSLDAPLYRTPDVARAVDESRDPVGQLDRMGYRLQTRSLNELDRLNRVDDGARDVRRLDVATVPEVDWRLGLRPDERRRLINFTNRSYYERENIPATGRLRKDDTLTGWREYIGRNGVRVYDSLTDSLDIPPPGLRGPTPAPGSTYR
jgi:hypothetical protein